MKNILFILLLLPNFLLSQTIEIKNDNYYINVNTLDSISLDKNFNPNNVEVTSWGDQYTHTIKLDTINQKINLSRNNITTKEEYKNEYIIIEKITTKDGEIYTLDSYDGSYAFIYLSKFTSIFAIEESYGIYKGILGYIE
tara:strand:- start:2658 stop:3077 length:420 start_codon:yes stop_codon:yes gene_type:complete